MSMHVVSTAVPVYNIWQCHSLIAQKLLVSFF